ncbi:Imm72 family immunity protein [Paraburkholderia terricola]|jgi:hypothetical protein|uniref:Imm72 family immunity protein n=1 Tax=Paraburkholderia terricola TaxID=169427 RepID=UPI001FD0979B|nr:Imm72 family immunity protein [Paraburkholderia terricola]
METMNQYDMQDDITRRKVFWLLKRLTSFTLWHAKREAFAAFTTAYETAVKTWPATQPEQMPADNLTTIYEILGLYDKGLIELARGYRFVWRDGEAFNRALDRYDHLTKYFYTDWACWDRGAQVAPYPARVDVLAKLMRASEFQMEHAPLEVAQVNDNLAQLRSPTLLLDVDRYKYQFYELSYPNFPETLPELPKAAGPIIFSGQNVPCDGIWEPVLVEQSKILGVLPMGAKIFSNNGCFNYLVAKTIAPNLKGFDATTSRATVDGTAWRLLWEDTRYKDGVIPDESQYFLVAKHEDAPADLADVPDVKTGDVCPVSGVWHAEKYGDSSIHVAAGAVMPDLLVADNLGEKKVHWVTWRLVKRT